MTDQVKGKMTALEMEIDWKYKSGEKIRSTLRQVPVLKSLLPDIKNKEILRQFEQRDP